MKDRKLEKRDGASAFLIFIFPPTGSAEANRFVYYTPEKTKC